MAGRRPLTRDEERKLLQTVRILPPRDRTLLTTQWLTGFRISEVLSLTVGSVFRNGQIVSRIGIAPRNMKGGYGRTRWVPVLPELRRAFESYVAWLRLRYEFTADLPLFLSRQDNPDGTARALTRETARVIVSDAFARAGIEDDGRLGTHTLRKTWARNVYENSGHDIILLRAAMNHSDVSITQRYLEVDAGELDAAIRKCDFTRSRRERRHTGPNSIAVAA